MLRAGRRYDGLLRGLFSGPIRRINYVRARMMSVIATVDSSNDILIFVTCRAFPSVKILRLEDGFR